MATLLFYEKPVMLDRERHRNVRIGPVTNYQFAANTNSIVLTGVEFTETCKEYPIVFAVSGDRLVPVALLGLRDDENLFVDGDGRWDARYVPAFVRRYPFVLADSGKAEFMVCVDESSPQYNSERGQALFDKSGKNSRFLDQTLEFMNAYQAQVRRTESFVRHLQTLELLADMAAKVELTDGRSFLLKGLRVIDEKKLMKLERGKAHALVKTGEIGWIYAHLISLSNMGRLTDRMAARK